MCHTGRSHILCCVITVGGHLAACSGYLSLVRVYANIAAARQLLNVVHSLMWFTASSPKVIEPVPLCVAAKRNVYQAHEEELYCSLSALINDAKNIRVYLASTMRLHSQTFGTALYG